jgi:hypothetical protein
MMRFLLILFLVFPFIGLSQKSIQLKSKYFGIYKGKIPTFLMDSGKDLLSVDDCSITIEIRRETIQLTIGSNKKSGEYKVLLEANDYFVLDCKINGQAANERIMVFKKGEKITRDGLFPQPNAKLFKTNN